MQWIKVQQIKEIIIENAKQEFKAIWQCSVSGIKKARGRSMLRSTEGGGCSIACYLVWFSPDKDPQGHKGD